MSSDLDVRTFAGDIVGPRRSNLGWTLRIVPKAICSIRGDLTNNGGQGDVRTTQIERLA